jgi:hypothetical protein
MSAMSISSPPSNTETATPRAARSLATSKAQPHTFCRSTNCRAPPIRTMELNRPAHSGGGARLAPSIGFQRVRHRVHYSQTRSSRSGSGWVLGANSPNSRARTLISNPFSIILDASAMPVFPHHKIRFHRAQVGIRYRRARHLLPVHPHEYSLLVERGSRDSFCNIFAMARCVRICVRLSGYKVPHSR